MKKTKFIIWALALVIASTSCTTKHYAVKSVEGSRILMDSVWDAKPAKEMAAIVNLYKTKMDAQMNEVIGTAAQPMTKGYPQSLLTNFVADAIRQYAANLWGEADFAVMNYGGIRTNMKGGAITVGDIFEILPFENTLVMLELPGKAVGELFDFYAFHGGQGLSDNVELVVKDRKRVSLKIGGQPLDENRTYRVATIDYLAEGNDGMTALTEAVGKTESGILLREAVIDYIKQLTAKNQLINAKLDDRIKIEK
ncbi:MAG: 5'-nucleotidase C-terminal domain-containing protein [Dysgonamonadaceae bacterium]|jgi:2',3'-cyclic-nucleotide 2'-phosphodiesterase (5'-nucleotidase family)|nr:5'-nucleotidase C-terminal domain-containing protein [Dysgonamonadaceae bacterium]